MPPYDSHVSTGDTNTWTSWSNTGTTSSSVWGNWATNTDNSSTGTWGTWVDEPSSSSDTTWVDWQTSPRPLGVTWTTNDPPQLTEEELAIQRQREEEPRQVIAKREEIKEKAFRLLRLFLMPQQIKQFTEGSFFTVRSQTGKRYKIRKGFGVEELTDDGRVVARYCIHHRWGLQLPSEDTMLAQKFMLETDEEEFLRIANRTPVITVETLAQD